MACACQRDGWRPYAKDQSLQWSLRWLKEIRESVISENHKCKKRHEIVQPGRKILPREQGDMSTYIKRYFEKKKAAIKILGCERGYIYLSGNIRTLFNVQTMIFKIKGCLKYYCYTKIHKITSSFSRIQIIFFSYPKRSWPSKDLQHLCP